MNSILQHAIERVERPGGSHEGVGRKKKLNRYASTSCDEIGTTGRPTEKASFHQGEKQINFFQCKKIFTLALVSPSFSHYFSPLSLRLSVAVVCFEVTIGDLLCLVGWRHVISGILAGGIPGFRMVRLLLHSPSGMAW